MIRTTGRLAAMAVLLAAPACKPWDGAAAAQPTATNAAADPAEEPSMPPATGFAADRVPGDKPAPAAIDGDRAMKYLKQLCDLGPRVSGTDGMARQQKLLADHFEKCGATVSRQEFQARQRSVKNPVGMTNLVASWHPDRARRVILCSHYDTRPAAHEENRVNWQRPFVSANDGTSGAAILMEVANHLKDAPTAVGVDVVLFDGEEYIFDVGAPGVREGDKYFLGSEHFAADYAKNRGKRPTKYEAAVLLDLCGHDGARLAVEGYSLQFAPRLVEQVWKTAEAVGAKSFKYERGFRRASDVLDDHIALNQAGIPAVDVIDFDYAHWHRLTDTPDKCSAGQMAEIGKVLTAWVSGLK